MNEILRNHKDTVFRAIFADKVNLLSLYNAVNGTKEMPEQWELSLSEACLQPKSRTGAESMLELTVQAFNINYGKNEKLLEACQKLKEYAQYVDKVRQCIKDADSQSGLGKTREECIREAIETAIGECIREGILGDFLKKNRAEALEMSWYEYNEELHIKNERKIAFEEGVEQERKNTEVQRKIAEEKSRQVQQAEMEIERLKKELDELKKGYSGN